MKMQQEQLLQLTKELALKYFERPFQAEMVFNGRLRTTGGRYIPSKRLIEINKKYLDELGIEELEGIIKHELCHHFLHIDQKPFHHRSKEFRALLRQTGSPRHCRMLPSTENERKYKYTRKLCAMIYRRKRRVNTNRYSCGKCRGKLVSV